MDDVALRAHVRLLLESCRNFSDMTFESRGILPHELAKLLHGEVERGMTQRMRAQSMLDQIGHPPSGKPFVDSCLPIPHPVDADWRFTVASAHQILSHVSATLRKGDILLLAAVPTLARVASTLRLPLKIVFAARQCDPVTESVCKLCPNIEYRDIRGDLGSVRADAAIIDPPWYDEIALPMVRKAMKGTQVGGSVYVCVPDIFTACSSAPLLVDAPAFASSLSTTAKLEPLLLRYETPFFEFNALRAAGVTNFHPQWRTGQFVRVKAVPTADCDLPGEEGWQEQAFGSSRIRFRRRPSARLGVSALPVLESVSRARWRQLQPTVVTSGNRFCSTQIAIQPSGELSSAWTAQLTLVAARENRDLHEHFNIGPARAYSSVDKSPNVVHL